MNPTLRRWIMLAVKLLIVAVVLWLVVGHDEAIVERPARASAAADASTGWPSPADFTSWPCCPKDFSGIGP